MSLSFHWHDQRHVGIVGSQPLAVAGQAAAPHRHPTLSHPAHCQIVWPHPPPPPNLNVHTIHRPLAGVQNLVQKGYKKMSPFFIPYAITNMGGALVAIEQVRVLTAGERG